MCLTLGLNYKERIAEGPITCFKVIIKNAKDNILRTPYMDMDIVIGKKYKTKILIEFLCGQDTVTAGFHSFENIEAAQSEANDWGYSCKYIPLIIKCQIPTGAKYYQGGFDTMQVDDDMNCYASDSIKYLKIVEIVE